MPASIGESRQVVMQRNTFALRALESIVTSQPFVQFKAGALGVRLAPFTSRVQTVDHLNMKQWANEATETSFEEGSTAEEDRECIESLFVARNA